MTSPTVEISTKISNDGEEDYWILIFAIRWADGSQYTFTSCEPCARSKESWLALARGEKGIGLYCGNGEGSICPDDGALRFVAYPSGSGGDVIADFRVPQELIRDPLIAAIEKAAADGLQFAAE